MNTKNETSRLNKCIDAILSAGGFAEKRAALMAAVAELAPATIKESSIVQAPSGELSDEQIDEIFDRGQWRRNGDVRIDFARAIIAADRALRPGAVPAGWQLAPVEPTHEITAAMLESEAQDDEGKFPPLCDLLDFSGANKALTVVTEAYRAGLAAAPQPPAAQPAPTLRPPAADMAQVWSDWADDAKPATAAELETLVPGAAPAGDVDASRNECIDFGAWYWSCIADENKPVKDAAWSAWLVRANFSRTALAAKDAEIARLKNTWQVQTVNAKNQALYDQEQEIARLTAERGEALRDNLALRDRLQNQALSIGQFQRALREIDEHLGIGKSQGLWTSATIDAAAAMRATHDAMTAERDKLAAQVEALRKDAGRYQFLRDIMSVEDVKAMVAAAWGAALDDESAKTDEAVDAEMAGHEGDVG